MSDQYRFGDETPPAARSERLFQDADTGRWFFRTREGTPMGPFETFEEADQALRDFIEFIRLADLQTLSELTRALGDDADASNALANEEAAALGEGGAQDEAASGNVSAMPTNSAAAPSHAGATPSATARVSVGAWDPQAHTNAPSTAALANYAVRFVTAVSNRDDLQPNAGALADLLSNLLSDDERAQFASWMRLPLSTWPGLLDGLGDAELIALVRVFALAEKALPGCDAGKHSPAIAFAKELRRRGSYPASLTAWIRQHSDNRFLPYGSLLERL